MRSLIKVLRRHISIKSRLLLMFLLPGIIYYLFSAALSFSHIKSISKARINELSVVVESAIGQTSAQFLKRGLKLDLKRVLTTLTENTAVSGITVYDIDGAIFASAGKIESGSGTIQFERNIFHSSVVANFDGIDFNEGINIGKPELIGRSRVIIDINNIDGTSWYAVIGDSFLLLITILICSPLFYALYQSFSSPLGKILKNILDFEKEDLNWIEEADIGSDEFSRVTDALRRVATTVINQQKQINMANLSLKNRAIELENQVKIATESREDADRANAQKDIFVANVSHEMRQPLVGVVSGVDLVEQFILTAQTRLMNLNNNATPDQIKALTNIRSDLKEGIKSLDFSKRYSKELTVMVNDLLASIQDMYHEIPLKISVFEIYDSIEILLKSHNDQVIAKGLKYFYKINKIDSEPFIYTKSDWVRVSQVVNALIDNAVRFTVSGKISVICDISKAESSIFMSIIIRDTGVGIGGAERDEIFKLFHIGEDPTNKQYSGLGIGLAIAQKIAFRLNGSLKLEQTSLGQGSEFSFRLSLPIASQSEITIREDRIQVNKPITLLYVEDSAINRIIFQQYCQLSGIELILAQDGNDGIVKYNNYEFDALVVDCFMPIMNGFEFTKKIREKEKKENKFRIPIFALTAEPSTKNKERCFAAGFDEFLTKPYTNATFKFIIDRIDKINTKNHLS